MTDGKPAANDKSEPCLAEALAALRRDGAYVVRGFLDPSEVDALRREFAHFLSGDAEDGINMDHPPGQGFRIVFNDAERRPRNFEDTQTFSVFQNQTLKDLAAAYLSQPAFFEKVIGTYDYHAGPLSDVHFDTRRSLKFMIYLKDTSEATGAFCYLPGTQKRNSRFRRRFTFLGGIRSHIPNSLGQKDRHRMVSVEAKAGTLIVFDTDVLHCGGVLQAGESREIIRASCPVGDEAGLSLSSLMPYRVRRNRFSPANLYCKMAAPALRPTRGTARAQTN